MFRSIDVLSASSSDSRIALGSGRSLSVSATTCAVTGSVVDGTGVGAGRAGTNLGVGVGVCAARDVAAIRQTTAVKPFTTVMKPSWTRLYYAFNCSEFRQ